MKSKGLIKTFAILGLVFGILGMVLAFLPLGLIAVLPAGIALLLGILAFLAAKNVEVKKNLILVVLVISILGILVSIAKTVFIEDKVAVDNEFYQKQDESLDESMEALDELSDEMDSELEADLEDNESK